MWKLSNLPDNLSVCFETSSLGGAYESYQIYLMVYPLTMNHLVLWRMQKLLNLSYDLSVCYETSSLLENVKAVKFLWWFICLLWNIQFSGECEGCPIYIIIYPNAMKHLVEWRMQKLLNLSYDLSTYYQTSSAVENIKIVKLILWCIRLLWNN